MDKVNRVKNSGDVLGTVYAWVGMDVLLVQLNVRKLNDINWVHVGLFASGVRGGEKNVIKWVHVVLEDGKKTNMIGITSWEEGAAAYDVNRLGAGDEALEDSWLAWHCPRWEARAFRQLLRPRFPSPASPKPRGVSMIL